MSTTSQQQYSIALVRGHLRSYSSICRYLRFDIYYGWITRTYRVIPFNPRSEDIYKMGRVIGFLHRDCLLPWSLLESFVEPVGRMIIKNMIPRDQDWLTHIGVRCVDCRLYGRERQVASWTVYATSKKIVKWPADDIIDAYVI